ncbi:hypothetical protein ACSYAD_25355 [Acaryochloris marina NIES-2412]|uniref:hypothetical protein n=1 Tax=Acaryochloris marina TaxID=155978 RepID=UPI0040598772
MRIKALFSFGLSLIFFFIITFIKPPIDLANAAISQVGCKLPTQSSALLSVLQKCVVPENNPDQFAWELFAFVNQAARFQEKTKQGQSTNNAIWETWADDPLTFPEKPDPSQPPQWPEKLSSPKQLRLRSKVEKSQPDADFIEFQKNQACTPENAPCEEVRRNKPAFNYIMNNDLWYTQGLTAKFQSAQKALLKGESVQDFIKFPLDSIEVKGDWVPITENQKSEFHWNYDEKGDLYGLIAMHISSKALPNWFWATFEWVDNYGRCDYIGCHDLFGVVPHNLPSKQAINQQYSPGKITPELVSLFKEHGLTESWGQEWQHYRLKGSMTDFTDSTGQPLLLGNSITEQGFVPSASCITCHSRAAVTSLGKDAFPIAGFRPFLPGVGETGSKQTVGSAEIQFPNGPLTQSYSGSPDPNWFYRGISVQNSAGVVDVQAEEILKNLQMDFVWAIPFNAKPAP